MRAQAIMASVLLAGLALAAVTNMGTATHTAVNSKCFNEMKWQFCYRLEEARGQGLELYSTSYDGTFLFYNAGVPFSITKYNGPGAGSFGPYKDILGSAGGTVTGYGYGAIHLTSADCPRFFGSGTLESGNTVCVERMTAGTDPKIAVWSKFNIANYRFLQGWIMHKDGTFEPKVVLGGNLHDAPCPGSEGSRCTSHFHYMYWRFDTDLNSWPSDRIQQFQQVGATATNQDPNTNCPSALSWCSWTQEHEMTRNYNAHGKWRVVDFTSTNSKGNAISIELYSNSQGPADAMSTQEVWGVRWKCQNVSLACEMGYQIPTTPTNDVPITNYDNNENMQGQDVVLWYAEKTHHEPRDEETPSMAVHEVGPLMKIRNWRGSNPGAASYP